MFYLYFDEGSNGHGFREFGTKQEALDAISDRIVLTQQELYCYKLIEGTELDLDYKVRVIEHEGPETSVKENAEYSIDQYLAQVDRALNNPSIYNMPKRLSPSKLMKLIGHSDESIKEIELQLIRESK